MSLAKNWIFFAASMAVAGLVTSGCSNQPGPNRSSEPLGPMVQSPEGASLPEGLAKLSETQRMAALKQVVCPVTGAKLGSMGGPPVITVNERDVFLCCAGCEEELRKDPGKYLAKMKSE